MSDSLFDSFLAFLFYITLGNLATFIYRFLCSAFFYRNVSLQQHVKNCCNAEEVVAYKELFVGSVLEEVVFRAPLLYSSNLLLYFFAVFGFGLMHFKANRENCHKNFFAFGEVISTSFFGYGTAKLVLDHGIYGFFLACALHVSMNFSIVASQRWMIDEKKILYTDLTGISHRYLVMKQSLLCHLLRQLVNT